MFGYQLIRSCVETRHLRLTRAKAMYSAYCFRERKTQVLRLYMRPIHFRIGSNAARLAWSQVWMSVTISRIPFSGFQPVRAVTFVLSVM